MADEYISKQRAKDLMGCCLASAKAQYKAEKNEFKKARYGDYISTIQAMIDVVGAVEVADVQPVKRGRWTDNVYKYVKSLDAYFIQAKCSVCGRYSDRIDIYSRFMSNECCSRCGARMDGDTE